MPAEVIRRQAVWSGRLRFTHWVIALTSLLLLASGWLLSADNRVPAPGFHPVHATAGYVLGLALCVRVWLLIFGRGPEHWRDLIPRATQLRSAGAMLRFYLTGGRAPLPAYYAHNPLWGPIYLLLFGVLAAQVASGLYWLHAGPADRDYYQALPWLFGWTLPEWHMAGYHCIGIFSIVHVVAVFWHDWKGGNSEISAMVHGHKYFIVRRPADLFPVELAHLRKKPGRRDASRGQ